MARLFRSVGRTIHDTSTALIDRQVIKKVSDVVTSSVKSGFDIVEDVLKVVQDVTKPREEEKRNG